MLVHEASILDAGIFHVFVHRGEDAAAHGVVFLVRGLDLPPESLCVLHVIVNEALRGAARERVHRFSSRARLDALIAAVDFRPGLLQDEHPDLIDVARGALRGP